MLDNLINSIFAAKIQNPPALEQSLLKSETQQINSRLQQQDEIRTFLP